jgi:hypothetical protein
MYISGMSTTRYRVRPCAKNPAPYAGRRKVGELVKIRDRPERGYALVHKMGKVFGEIGEVEVWYECPPLAF